MVLYISLLLLLVLTLIGLAATRSTTSDERMAGTQRDHDLAFQAAEAALRDGESMLVNASPGDFDDTNGLYDSDASITWETADWSDTGMDPALRTLSYTGTFIPAPAHPPRFYLVRTAQTGAAPGQSAADDSPAIPATIYKVTAKGWGFNVNDTVILESTYEVSKPGTGARLSWQQLL
ncbi:MAG TPA: PilX N-terminal domain-containing pilus assembly protein [Gammaproteobacteria bacterium]|nr:PilX N-terminal domain-containing pilus assembly protein [Gammaproteobacteria bacterium]